jgi:hypothetical protein
MMKFLLEKKQAERILFNAHMNAFVKESAVKVLSNFERLAPTAKVIRHFNERLQFQIFKWYCMGCPSEKPIELRQLEAQGDPREKHVVEALTKALERNCGTSNPHFTCEQITVVGDIVKQLNLAGFAPMKIQRIGKWEQEGDTGYEYHRTRQVQMVSTEVRETAILAPLDQHEWGSEDQAAKIDYISALVASATAQRYDFTQVLNSTQMRENLKRLARQKRVIEEEKLFIAYMRYNHKTNLVIINETLDERKTPRLTSLTIFEAQKEITLLRRIQIVKDKRKEKRKAEESNMTTTPFQAQKTTEPADIPLPDSPEQPTEIQNQDIEMQEAQSRETREIREWGQNWDDTWGNMQESPEEPAETQNREIIGEVSKEELETWAKQPHLFIYRSYLGRWHSIGPVTFNYIRWKGPVVEKKGEDEDSEEEWEEIPETEDNLISKYRRIAKQQGDNTQQPKTTTLSKKSKKDEGKTRRKANRMPMLDQVKTTQDQEEQMEEEERMIDFRTREDNQSKSKNAMDLLELATKLNTGEKSIEKDCKKKFSQVVREHMAKATVVFATTHGAGDTMIKEWKPDVVMTDESQRLAIDDSTYITACHRDAKCIFAGDTRQLGVHQSADDFRNPASLARTESFMSMLKGYNFPVMKLANTYRYLPEYAKAMEVLFYKQMKSYQTNPGQTTLFQKFILERIVANIEIPFDKNLRPYNGTTTLIIMVQNDRITVVERLGQTNSPMNMSQAQKVIQLSEEMKNFGLKAPMVINPYKAQDGLQSRAGKVNHIRTEQAIGLEYDFVILDTTTTEDFGFQLKPAMFLQAIIRAKTGCIVIISEELYDSFKKDEARIKLKKGSNYFGDIEKFCRKKGTLFETWP